jgi:hypothetical protein
MQRYRETKLVPPQWRGPTRVWARVVELEDGEETPEGALPVPADTELHDWRQED